MVLPLLCGACQAFYHYAPAPGPDAAPTDVRDGSTPASDRLDIEAIADLADDVIQPDLAADGPAPTCAQLFASAPGYQHCDDEEPDRCVFGFEGSKLSCEQLCGQKTCLAAFDVGSDLCDASNWEEIPCDEAHDDGICSCARF